PVYILHPTRILVVVTGAPGPSLVPYTPLFRSHPVMEPMDHRDLEVLIDGAWERRRNLTLDEVEGSTRPTVERVIAGLEAGEFRVDRKSTRLNSSHVKSSYAVFCLKKQIRQWLS